MATTSEDYLFKARTAKETERLNQQHKVIVRLCNGQLVHPLIPLSTLHSVADVATGTGNWLEDLVSQLGANVSRLDGFDISPAQFPPENIRAGNYLLQDILKPFPEKYHGVYDLVHVRYLVVAIPADQFEVAAKSLFQILKPGGYIQWEEIDIDDMHYSPHPVKPYNTDFITLLSNLTLSKGMSTAASTLLCPAFLSAGFSHIITETRNSYWFQDQDRGMNMKNARIVWMENVITALLPASLLFSGRASDESEAEGMVEDFLKECRKEWEVHGPVNLAHRIAIGWKPIGSSQLREVSGWNWVKQWGEIQRMKSNGIWVCGFVLFFAFALKFWWY